MGTRPITVDPVVGPVVDVSHDAPTLAVIEGSSRFSAAAVFTWAARTVDAVVVALVVSFASSMLGVWGSLTFAAAALAASWSTGMVRGRLLPQVSDELWPMAQRIGFAMLGVGLVAELAVIDLVQLGLLVWAAVLAARGFVYAAVRGLRRSGRLIDPIVVVGAGPISVDLVETLEERPEYGLRPIGFVDDRPPSSSHLPYLGQVADLPRIMQVSGARDSLFAYGLAREAEMISTIRGCDRRFRFYVLLRFFELGVASGSPQVRTEIAGYPLLRIRPPAHAQPTLRAKRVFDVVMSLAVLIPVAPIMAACAVAVRLSSPGPALFRQLRVGRDGRTFEILKFRSMTVNNDSDTTWSVETDNRVTKVGAFLRASHLDEIPQLLNVLRGDMSIVGPRPERPHFVNQFETEVRGYQDRHRVKSGITGWSQVNGLVGDTSIEDRARLDNWYIENWSFWSDMLIILRTLPTVSFRGE